MDPRAVNEARCPPAGEVLELERSASLDEIVAICVRLYRREDGMVLTADCPVGVRRRRAGRLALAAVGGSLLAAACALGSMWLGRASGGEPVRHTPRAWAPSGEAPAPESRPLSSTAPVVEPSGASTVETAAPVVPERPDANRPAQRARGR